MTKTYEEVVEEMGYKFKEIQWLESHCPKDAKEAYTELFGMKEIIAFMFDMDFVEVDADVRHAAE